MDAKEKAKELVERFKDPMKNGSYYGMNHAKQCALIAVEEILNELVPIDFATNYAYDELKTYWVNTKQEIIKL